MFEGVDVSLESNAPTLLFVLIVVRLLSDPGKVKMPVIVRTIVGVIVSFVRVRFAAAI